MINQLRHESCSGSIDDLAHVVSEDCLSDCLTKNSAKATALIKAVNEGISPNVDKHPSFREMMRNRHKAYSITDDLVSWIARNVSNSSEVVTFLSAPVKSRIEQYLISTTECPRHFTAGRDAGSHSYGECMYCGCCIGTCHLCSEGLLYENIE